MEELSSIYLEIDKYGTSKILVDVTTDYILIDEFRYEEKYYYLYRHFSVKLPEHRKTLLTKLTDWVF